MDPVRIDVKSAARNYPVFIGRGLAAKLPQFLADASLGDPVIVSAAPVWRHHGDLLDSLAGEAGPVLMADGERAKTLATVSRLYDAFAKRLVSRTTTVVAVGGGVVGDVAGFAAATYLRGLPLVQVPTTLLAQVDSAVGGKVGVNLPAGKNLAGAFHPPALVLCDSDLLTTLPRREFRAGLYEVVKYGVIASPSLFERVSHDLDKLFAHDHESLAAIVTESCRIKADVVGQDEREAGPRRVLNFGHTIGHALEAITDFRRFRHGEAIAYGMLAAAHISVARQLMPAPDSERLQELIRRMGPLPPVGDLSRTAALDAASHDKKVANGRLHFVLSSGFGTTHIASDVTPAELTTALASIGIGA